MVRESLRRATLRVPVFGLALCGFLVFTPLAAAHAAPPPAGYETRLLHDCNDDYFGGDAVGSKNGHDVIALDLQERYDTALGADVIVFKLIMNAGFGGSGSPTLTEDVVFKVGSASKTFSVSTDDNERFTGNFDRIEGPSQVYTQEGSPDGERFTVAGVVKLSTIATDVGAKLSAFEVTSYVDGSRRDFMPGGYQTAAGTTDPVACQGDDTSFQRPDYVVKGPTMYATMRVSPQQASLATGNERLINLEIQNSQRNHDQSFRLTGAGGEGLEWSFHNPETDSYDETFEDEIVANGQTLVHLAVTGVDAGATGTLTVTLTTDLGGRVVKTFSYSVQAAGGGSTPTTTGGGDGGGAPAPGLVSVAFLVSIAVWLRRRGRA